MAAPCDPSTVLELESASARANQAFAALDLQAFERARDDAMTLLPCLDEAITASAAAGYYRVLAMDAFIAQDLDAVEEAFGASRQAYPGYRLPSNVAPRNHPLRLRYESAGLREWEVPTEVPVPLEATLLVHGRHQLSMSRDRPSIAQLLDEDGQVVWTRYIAAGGPLPEYEEAPEDMRAKYLEQRVIMAPTHRRPYELVVTSGVLLASAVTLELAAMSARRQFDDPKTPYEEVPSLRGRINGLNIGGVVTGVAGLGVGALAVVRW